MLNICGIICVVFVIGWYLYPVARGLYFRFVGIEVTYVRCDIDPDDVFFIIEGHTCECGYDQVKVWKWSYDEVAECFIPYNSRKPWRAYCNNCGMHGQPGVTKEEAIANWIKMNEYAKQVSEEYKAKAKQKMKKGGKKK